MVETSGYKAWWPMKQFKGRGKDGSYLSDEVYRNIVTGDVHKPHNGWNGRPPEHKTGEKNLTEVGSEYARRYDLIQWD